MKTVLLLLFCSINLLAADHLQEPLAELTENPKAIKFHDFTGFEFTLSTEITGRIISPKEAAPGNPWIWRARFWGHQPALDLALLNQGYHLCFCDVSNLFGSPTAVARWNEFYSLSQKLSLHPKPILEGMSRGGLIAFNWAKANPEKVSAIYGDNPVCDIHSWPREKSPRNWNLCLKAYEMTETESETFQGNPIDGLEALVAAEVPLFFVLGLADQTVPVEENAFVLTERYQKLGGQVTTWKKPGLDHHPHGLDPVEPLFEALLKAQKAPR